jgi:glutaredoxin-related protein
VKGTRTEPQCGFSHRVLTLLNEARIDYEVGSVTVSRPGIRLPDLWQALRPL